MKFTATLEITVDDEAMRELARTAGVPLPNSDTELAALMMAMTHTYRSARAFLLTTDHTPMEYGETYRMTDPKDPAFDIMLTLNQGLLPCPDPSSPPKPASRTASPPSRSTSPSTKNTTASKPRSSSARSSSRRKP